MIINSLKFRFIIEKIGFMLILYLPHALYLQVRKCFFKILKKEVIFTMTKVNELIESHNFNLKIIFYVRYMSEICIYIKI